MNHYYHKSLQELAQFLIPEDASVIGFSCCQGELLAGLPNKEKISVEESEEYENFKINKKFDYILLSNTLQYVDDIQLFIRRLKMIIHDDSRIIVIGFNFSWKLFLDLAEKLGLRVSQARQPNW